MHKNLKNVDDILREKDVTDGKRKFIHNEFKKLRGDTTKIVIEKRCANCLRVEYINKIFPNARFIYIERNPYDSISSAMIRWKSNIELNYFLKKLRYMPFIDYPYHFITKLKARIDKLFSSENILGSWGPMTKKLIKQKKDLTLLEICTLQWIESTSHAKDSLAKIDQDRVLSISYEDISRDTRLNLSKIYEFLDVEADENFINFLSKESFHIKSIDKYKQILTQKEISTLKHNLEKEGY